MSRASTPFLLLKDKAWMAGSSPAMTAEVLSDSLRAPDGQINQCSCLRCCGRASKKHSKCSARGSEFLKPIQRDLGRPDQTQEIIRFSFSEIDVFFAPTRLMQRGVRVVTIRGVRVAVDATASARVVCSQGGSSVSGHSAQTNGAVAYGKTVWSWHPWLVSS